MKSLLTFCSSTSECVIKISFVAFALAVMYAGVHLSKTIALGELRQIGAQRLELYVSSLRGVLDRYEYLPFIISGDKDVIRLLENPDDKVLQNVVNRLLEKTNQVAGSADLFIMDATGRTVAASNWQETLTFIGQTYAFRPYFQLAILGGLARYFAIGVTTGQPGFFLSWPIRRDDKLLGVAVVKVNLDPLQNDWTAAGDNIIVTDSDQIIFLSSRPAWRYTSLGNISATVRKRLDETRKYHSIEIKPLEIVKQEGVDPKTRILTIREPAPRSEENQQAEISYLAQSVSLSRVDWQVHILSNLAPVQRSERNALIVITFSLLCTVLLYLYLRQRRLTTQSRDQALREAQAELEQRIQERTQELIESNKKLHSTQEELIKTSKLAAMGQLSAAIAHELNQPLASIRAFSATTIQLLDLGRSREVRENMGQIRELTERMEHITKLLRNFARGGAAQLEPVYMNRCVEQAVSLLAHRIQETGAEFIQELPDRDILILGDKVGLEQVLINLIQNALDAIENVVSKRILLRLWNDSDSVFLAVEDSGPGIRNEDLTQLFKPFASTKQTGERLGLGLALAYEMIKALGGTIEVRNTPHGGAQFTVRIPEFKRSERQG